MDPDACYERMCAALETRQFAEAREAAADLATWLRRQGHPPAGLSSADALNLANAVHGALGAHLSDADLTGGED